MIITIIPADKVVTVNGVSKTLDIDWAPYAAIHAAQATIDRDRAEIEFRDIDPDGDGPLPSYKPPNELIGAAEFYERFAPLIAAYDAAPAPVRPTPSDRQPLPDEPASDIAARLSALEAKFNILFEEVSKARGQS